MVKNMLRGWSWCLIAVSLAVLGADAKPADGVYDDPEHVDADFAYQGEYVGELGRDSEKMKWGIQVIALGKGKFQAVGYPGGLPGDGGNAKQKVTSEGELKDGIIHFASDHGAAVVDGKGGTQVLDLDKNPVGELKKVERKSPTLAAKPPEGAIVLFDGKSTDALEHARVTKDGLLMQGFNTKQTFGDCQVHLEFRTPYMPEARGQGRGNSGCYLQGRYEVQILDSFGLEGKNNEAGGIYTIKDPAVNMCLPPLAWQTYDIEYTAAKFDDAGKKVKHATMTVKHNGVVVQDKTELTHSTTASPNQEGPANGFLYVQDHGNPVRFRNIWVVTK